MAELTNLERIGQAVAHARNQRGWSQDKLAEEVGLHRQTVIKVELGELVQGASLASICEAVGLHLTVSRDACEHDFERVCRLCGERAS